MRTILIFSLLLGLAGGLPVAWGQTGEARITGTVTDSNGAVIPGARLTVKNQKTGVSRDAAASDQRSAFDKVHDKATKVHQSSVGRNGPGRPRP